VVFGYSFIDFPNQFKDPQKVSKKALNMPFPGLFKNGLDLIPGYSVAWGAGPAMLNPGGFDPVLFATKHLTNVSQNLTKVLGTHTLKAGAYYEHVINNQPGNEWSNGFMIPQIGHSLSTNNATADLLLGRLNDYTESTKNVLRNIAFNTFEFYVSDSWKANRKLTLDLGMRFYHLGKWYDRQGFGFAVFDRSKYNRADAEAGKLPGVLWHDIDPSIPLSGAPTRPLFAAPRFGFAYDLFGSGRTVLRGGFGTSYYHDAQLTSGLDIAAGLKKVSSLGVTTISDINSRSANADVVRSFEALDPNDDKQPVTHSWSFTIQQRLPWAMSLEAAYVGNKSNDQLFGSNINTVKLNDPNCLANPEPNCDQHRELRGFGTVTLQRHIAYQNYNALQVTLSRQRGRVSYLASYSFSKALGIRNGGNQGAGADALDLRGHNYGILGYDRTHIFNVAYSIELPNFAKEWMNTDNWAAKGVLDGWQLSGISQFASGYPLQANNVNFRMSGTVNGVDISNPRRIAGTPDTTAQPILTCDPRKGLGEDQYINPNCFAPPTPGNNGAYVFPYLKG
ncbi:MAG TPA: carboxypeptidase regulatory-like domain-containing protein, partial [Blastocatellia bacterium]|nr:carboxypeptidase regulatory-like domain-containing protein [Blastocatellia bacterium]